jgi:hypothetical protein
VPLTTTLPEILTSSEFSSRVFRLNATIQNLDLLKTKIYLVPVLQNQTNETLIPDNAGHFNDSFFEFDPISMNPPYFPIQYYFKLIFTWGGRNITLTTHNRYITGFFSN